MTANIIFGNNELKKYLSETLQSQKETIDKAVTKFREEYENWLPTYKEKKEQYKNEIVKLGGDFQKLEESRKLKAKEIEKIEKVIANLSSKLNQISEVNNKRNKKLEELQNIYAQYSRERIERCIFFEKHSNKKLQITMEESTNRDEFKKSLLSLKKGSYLRDIEIEQLCTHILPKDFILEILRYDTQRQDEPKKSVAHLKNIAEQTGISVDTVKNLADHLLNEISYEELLVLQYKAIPTDTPDIKYNVGNEAQSDFVPLRKLSTGQKCTTMLILSLSQGKMPVIIDQPEDSLDIRAIWEDMCTKLRFGKDERQFIFTTHNSSVAVASDSDKFMILEATSTKGEIVMCGAIDNPLLKKEVIQYLEGGKGTYGLKYRKYNISF